MITDPEGTVLALFAAFCRIGGCIMIMPGFSTARIPMQVRLFIAVAISMAILPVMWTDIYPQVTGKGHTYIYLIAAETLVGVVMGLVARYYVLGLQFAGSAITMLMGFSPPPSSDVLEDTPENQLTSLISFAGLMVLFMLDFHHVMFEAIVQSYRAMPIGTAFDPQGVLITLTDSLTQTFMIMLRLASPFIIYGLLFNVAIGMVNKLAPQIPIYFISQPYLIMGGMFLLYLGIAAMLRLFGDGFAPVMQGDSRMKTRSQKLKRLVAVQRHLEQMAEADYVEMVRQREVLAETIDVVVDAMGSAHPMHRMFSGHYSSQVGRLVQKDQMLHGIQQTHEARMLRERAKADRLEENMKEARQFEDREEADNAIYDLIDQHVTGQAPASRKVDGR